MGAGRTFVAHRARVVGVEGFEKDVVVKIPRPEIAADPGKIERIVARARSATSLSHANVAQLLDAGSTERDGTTVPFIVIELARGLPLRKLVDDLAMRLVNVPLAAILAMGAGVARALDYAHRKQDGPRAHGALHAGQVFVGKDGDLKVTDFAIASLDDERTPADDLRALAALLEACLPIARGPSDGTTRRLLQDLASGACSSAGAAYERLLETAFSLAPDVADRDPALFHESRAKKERLVISVASPSDPSVPTSESETASASTSARGGAPRFVGRTEELRSLGIMLEGVVERGAMAIAVEGPAGIGKSRLVDELALRLASGAQAVPMKIVRRDTMALPPRPYGAIGDLARALAGVRADGVASSEDVTRSLRLAGLDEVDAGVLASVMGVAAHALDASSVEGALVRAIRLAAAGGPIVIALDGDSILDTASAAVLEAVLTGPRARDLPMLLLLVRRNSEGGTLPTTGATQRISELHDDAVAVLIAERLGATVVSPDVFEHVAERAGGNPLFVDAIVREALESGAVRVEGSVAEPGAAFERGTASEIGDVAAERVASLPAELCGALATAAILDGPLGARDVVDALELPAEVAQTVLDELASRGLGRTSSTGALHVARAYSDRALEYLDAQARDSLHFLLGEAACASARSAPELAPTELARRWSRGAEHLLAAGSASSAAAAWLEAARCLESSAPVRALELVARALVAVAEPAPARSALESVARLAWSADLRALDLEEGIAHALELVDGAFDADVRVGVRLAVGVAIGARGLVEAAEVLLAQAEAIGAPSAGAFTLATHRLRLAALAGDPSRATDALATFSSAVEGKRESPTPRELADGIETALLLGDAAIASALLSSARAEQSSRDEALRLDGLRAELALVEHRTRDAEPILTKTLEAAREGGLTVLAARAALNLSRTADRARAFALLDEARSLAREASDLRTEELAAVRLGSLQGSDESKAEVQRILAHARASGRGYAVLALEQAIAEVAEERR